MEDVIIPEVINVKYPDFASLPLRKKVDIFTDELVSDTEERSIEVLLMNLGVSMDDYKLITSESNYTDMIHDKSYKMVLMPYVPRAYKKLGEDAEFGDAQAIKMIMQTGDKLSPEKVTLINQNLIHMDVTQLVKELDQLKIEAKELED